MSEKIAFIDKKISDAQTDLKWRKDGEAAWRDGSAEVWRAVGCRKSKAERLKLSEIEGRIAAKIRAEIEILSGIKTDLTDLSHFKERAERAEKWIKKHAVHPYDCEVDFEHDRPCTCGLDRVKEGK